MIFFLFFSPPIHTCTQTHINKVERKNKRIDTGYLLSTTEVIFSQKASKWV